jgi:hypothetical protein
VKLEKAGRVVTYIANKPARAYSNHFGD